MESLLFLIFLTTVVTIKFYVSSRKNFDCKKVSFYNLGSIFIAVLITVLFSFWMKTWMTKNANHDAGYWIVIASMVSPIIFIISIIIAGIFKSIIFPFKVNHNNQVTNNRL